MDDEMIEEVPAKKKHFEGFRKPEKPETGFYHLPNEWTDIASEIDNLAELKIIEYIMRHTWGFKEYDSFKHITVDEFMYGRISNGERMDKGTGLKSDRSVKDGLKAAIEHGYLLCDVDAKDKARIKKSYKLKMRQVESTPHKENREVESTPHKENREVESTPLEGSNYPSGTQNLPLQQVDTTPRSEKETSERHFEKDTSERKNGKSSKSTTSKTSFSHSSSSSQKSSEETKLEVLFSPEAEQVYQFAEKLNLVYLKRDKNHRDSCNTLIEKGITTFEMLKSLYEYSKQLSFYADKVLNLKNLVKELPGWLQTQQPKPLTGGQLSSLKFSDRGHYGLPPVSSTAQDIAATIPDAGTAGMETTDDHIIEKMGQFYIDYKDNGDFDAYIEKIWIIRDNFDLDNYALYDIITNAYRGTLRLNDASMQDFFEELEGMLEKEYQSVS